MLKDNFNRFALFASKYLTTRQLRLVLVRSLLTHIPFIRHRYALYTKTVPVYQINGKKLSSIDSNCNLDLTEHQFKYYRDHGYVKSELNDHLQLKMVDSEYFYLIHKTQVLSKIGVMLNMPSEAIVSCENKKLERYELKPHRYKHQLRVNGNVISILKWRDYFHFMFNEVLPLLRSLENNPELHDASLLIRENFTDYQNSVVNLVKKHYPDLKTVTVDSDTRIECENLLVYCNKREKLVDYMTHGETLNHLRRWFLQWTETTDLKPYKRIYISRNRYKYRNLENEEEVIALLEPLGFEIVLPELLSFKDQVTLFSSAQLIVATSGSALNNLLFCKPGTSIIETRRKDAMPPLYVGLSKQMGMNHYFLPGTKAGLYRSFAINIDDLSNLLQHVIEAHKY